MRYLKHIFTSVLAVASICSCLGSETVAPDDDNDKNAEEGVTDGDAPCAPSDGKTLLVYYSYTGNTKAIVEEIKKNVACDVVEVVPEGKYDYNANNYKIGADQINAINANPAAESSYPKIKDVKIDMDQYSIVIIATPLWHARMASNMQTILFKYGKQMSGKVIGLVVSSHSSGISGVESDAKRLVPGGKFSSSLWINASSHSKRASLVENWIKENKFGCRPSE